MTDFVRNALNQSRGFIITRRTQQDFYKYPMKKFILTYFPNVIVTFKLIVRTKDFPLALIIREEDLRRELDHVETVMHTTSDIAYIGGLRVDGKVMFGADDSYVEHLRTSRLPPYSLTRVGDHYELEFTGNWIDVTEWEMYALAIIYELKSRAITAHMSPMELEVYYGRATDKLYRNLVTLRDTTSLSIMGFGLRRHDSFGWESFAYRMAREVLGPRFAKISTLSLAQEHDIEAGGTNAHELIMVVMALASAMGPGAMREALYDVLRKWEPLFYGKLLTMLPDAYGTQMFFDNMPKDLAEHIARTWTAIRGDSGGMIEEGERALAFWRKWGADPKQKLYIPSDGLDVPGMQELDRHFKGVMPLSAGWGTGLTNDMKGIHPRADEQAVLWGNKLNLTWDQICGGQSIVCKVHKVNGIPAVKFSNNIQKATGDPKMVEHYKDVFGYANQVSEAVLV